MADITPADIAAEMAWFLSNRNSDLNDVWDIAYDTDKELTRDAAGTTQFELVVNGYNPDARESITRVFTVTLSAADPHKEIQS